MARLIDTYIIPRSDLKGILNISGQSISKFDLLKILANVYNKSIEIIPNESMNINRTLNGSQFNKLTGYRISPWSSLIKSMYEFNLLKNEFEGKTFLITGGTGSFGSTVCNYLLKNKVKEIRIFSRTKINNIK